MKILKRNFKPSKMPGKNPKKENFKLKKENLFSVAILWDKIEKYAKRIVKNSNPLLNYSQIPGKHKKKTS